MVGILEKVGAGSKCKQVAKNPKQTLTLAFTSCWLQGACTLDQNMGSQAHKPTASARALLTPLNDLRIGKGTSLAVA